MKGLEGLWKLCGPGVGVAPITSTHIPLVEVRLSGTPVAREAGKVVWLGAQEEAVEHVVNTFSSMLDDWN